MDVSLESRAAVGVALVVAGLLLVSTTAPLGLADGSGQQAEPETDNTVTRIAVAEDGSAHWTVRIRTRLDTAERVEEYETFRDRFRNDTTQYLDPFRDRMTGVVANAANATDRGMRARDFAASTSIQEVPRRWGVVTYEFTWTNFAQQNGDRLIVGDVFEGGFFLADNDTLEVEAPAGHGIEQVEPSPHARDDGVVTWGGREDFADRTPRVVFTPSAGDRPGASDANESDEGVGLTVVLGGLGLVAIAALTVAVLSRRDGDASAVSTNGDPPVEGSDGTDRGPGGSTPVAEQAGATTPATTGPEETAESTPMMTEEERVVALLEDNGGRMKQATIADVMDWSASKTSRTIGQMAEDGDVEKLQIGRENLVALPGEVD